MRSLRYQLVRLRRIAWRDAAPYLTALIVLACSFLFIKLADAVRSGSTQKFDERVLLSLRRTDTPEIPVGPPWLREAALDATALGSPFVLVLVVSAVVGFLNLQRRYPLAFLVVLTAVGGTVVQSELKQLIGRARPSIVPHLREVTAPSFPSGHAMLSAIVFLTLAALLMPVMPDRRTKLFCLIWALLLTLLVGLSRIYLGVHYPTDVLAGWMAGLVWALLSMALRQLWRGWHAWRVVHRSGAAASGTHKT